MLRAAPTAQFGIRNAQDRVVLAGIDQDLFRVGIDVPGAPEERIPDDAFGLPRLHRVQLFGEPLRVGCGMECFFRQNCRGLVVPVAVARRSAERQHDHVGPELANHPDDVGERLLASPLADGLFRRFREAEIDGAREVLLSAVHAARHEQLLRPDDAEQSPLLAAEQVLPTLAARQRQVAGAQLASLRVVGERAVVLVVRVGGDHQ